MRIGRTVIAGLVAVGAAWTCARGQAPAEQDRALVVEQAVIARAVEEREPVGESTTFAADVGQVACFTKIVGAAEPTFVEHVWRQGDTERARVRLPVRSAAWRTWSTKNIDPSWTGPWTVQVLDADERVLETLSFTILEAGETGPEPE